MDATQLKTILARLRLHWRQCRTGEMPRQNLEDYADLLRHMDADVAEKAVSAALLDRPDFMPTEARILANAAEIASPLPNSGDLWAEFQKAVGTKNPVWSHAYMERVVRRLGGWSHFANVFWGWSDVDEASIWYPRFLAAFEGCASEWRAESARELRLPPGERKQVEVKARSIADPKPTQVGANEMKQIEAEYTAVPMPDSVKEQFASLRRKFDMPSEKPPLTRDQIRAAESEYTDRNSVVA